MARTPAAKATPTLSHKGKPLGRPPEPIPQDIVDAACLWLESGLPLTEFCRQKGMPKRSTFLQWCRADVRIHEQVERAREVGFGALAEEALRIADDATNDYMLRNGKIQVDTECVQRSRLRVETRLKLLACWDPRRYGPKAEIAHTGKMTFEALVNESLKVAELPADVKTGVSVDTTHALPETGGGDA